MQSAMTKRPRLEQSGKASYIALALTKIEVSRIQINNGVGQ